MLRIALCALVLITMSCAERPSSSPKGELKAGAVSASIPSSARGVETYGEGALDELRAVRFEAPLTDARRFVRDVAGADAVEGYDPGLRYLVIDRAWWPKDFPAGGAGVERRREGTTIKAVLVPRGGSAIVWLAMFTQ